MEHLPTRATSRPIDVPYLCTENFEGDSEYGDALADFKSYWQRNRWEWDILTGDLLFENRSPEDITKSLQACLYFGCLISVFQRLGINVRTSDFVDTSSVGGEKFVRTTRLPSLIADWMRREGFASGPVVPNFDNPKYLRGENIKEMLWWSSFYLKMFHQQSEAMTEPHKGRIQLVELSIMAMAESLCSVLVAVYGYESQDVPSWGPSAVLKARLGENGWCKSDSPFFPESTTRATICADYYFGSSVCPRSRQDHEKCDMAICNEYCQVIAPKTYEQKHVFPHCSCAAVLVPDEARHLVDQGKIPLLQWHKNQLLVSGGDPHTRYVTMSHVWSDGIGNDDKTNSLWTCQLTRIQSLVNKLYAEPHRLLNSGADEPLPVPFWIDTLCVPVGDKDLRNRAIRQMAEVYRRGDSVLVLDSFILKQSRSANVIEKYLAIHLSNWHHRLWTMQEGQLARSLFFQFADGAESFADMKHIGLQGFNERTPQNVCSPVLALCAAELEAFYRFSELMAPSAAPTHTHRRDIPLRPGSWVDHLRALLCGSPRAPRPTFPHGEDITARLRSCAKYLRSRQTSRLEDESICVANILGLDAGQVLDHKDPFVRMAGFYNLVGFFDPRIIFNRHPRLPQDGYRWAPRSFLHQLPDLIEDTIDAPPTTRIIPGGGGLPVRFGGFELNSTVALQPGTSVFIKPSTDGRTWTPPPEDNHAKPPWWACIFKMEIQNVLEDASALTRPGDRWAVILPDRIGSLSVSPFGILGVVDANLPPNPSMSGSIQRKQIVWTTNGKPSNQAPAYSVPYRIPFRHVCYVHMTTPARDRIPQNASFVGGWTYSPQQEWCIL